VPPFEETRTGQASHSKYLGSRVNNSNSVEEETKERIAAEIIM
jgi:hypothetical protein